MSARLALLVRVAFWCALAFAYICALIPGGPELEGSDKFTHLVAFGTLAFLARVGWARQRVLAIALALILFGIFIEISQMIPALHRDAEAMDVVADAGGVALGLLAGSVARWLIGRMDAALLR